MVVREDFLSAGFRASNEVVVIAEMGEMSWRWGR